MRRARERGHAALWIIGVLAVSAGAGYGAYVLLKAQRLASAADDVPITSTPPVADRPPAPPPAEPIPDRGIEQPPPVPATPVDPVEAAAVDPYGNATFGSPGVTP